MIKTKRFYYCLVFLLSIFSLFFLKVPPAFATTITLYPIAERTLLESTGGANDGVMQLGNTSGTSQLQ